MSTDTAAVVAAPTAPVRGPHLVRRLTILAGRWEALDARGEARQAAANRTSELR
jgi:hypothetical protein